MPNDHTGKDRPEDLPYLIDNFEYARDPTGVRQAVERIARLIGDDPDFLLDPEVSPVQNIEYQAMRFMRVFVQRMLDSATGNGEMRPDVALGCQQERVGRRRGSIKQRVGQPPIDRLERDAAISIAVAKLHKELDGTRARRISGAVKKRIAERFSVSSSEVSNALKRCPIDFWSEADLK